VSPDVAGDRSAMTGLNRPDVRLAQAVSSRYALLLVVLQMAFGVFGPNPISVLLTGVIAFIPLALVAIIIVVITVAIATAVRELISTALGGLSYGRTLANIAAAFILGIGVIAALNQVGIATTVTTPILIAVLAAVVGVIVVGVGGGLIKPMQTRWESYLVKAEQEAPKVKEQAANAPVAPSRRPPRRTSSLWPRRATARTPQPSTTRRTVAPTPAGESGTAAPAKGGSGPTARRVPTSSSTEEGPIMTISAEQVSDVIGQPVTGPEGEKLGDVGEVYLDDETVRPEWVTVRTGLFGTKETFVPIAQASMADGGLSVPYSKDVVKDAPRIDAEGHLSKEEEAQLYRHHGLDYGDARSDTGRPEGRSGTGEHEPDHRVQAAAGSDGQDTSGHDTSGPNTDQAMTRSEERLHVSTEQPETGKVRLRKHIVTKQQTVTVPVQREEVRVEREPITDENRGAAISGGDLTEEEHEMTLHEERPVVQKETVPVERVKLAKEATTDHVEGQRGRPQGADCHQRSRRRPRALTPTHVTRRRSPAGTPARHVGRKSSVPRTGRGWSGRRLRIRWAVRRRHHNAGGCA